ncbi:MAG: hypothetical protein ABIP20_20985 [Chthoniobacteraceae bacterium]
MKTKILLAVATAAIIGAASLFAVGDQPVGSGAPAPAAPQPAAEMSCHAKAATAPAHGCCMGSGHAAGHGTAAADAAAGSCHKK